VGEGRKGKMVATGLHNWAMPLIRYETNDSCIAATSRACACGRRLPQIHSLYGFVEDPITTPDGRRLTGLDSVFNAGWGIKMGQIVQTSRTNIEVRLVKDTCFQDQDATAILDALRLRTGNGMELKVAFVRHIEPTEEGKFKWVRSEII
jgi:phenylacetate-CoA ligase